MSTDEPTYSAEQLAEQEACAQRNAACGNGVAEITRRVSAGALKRAEKDTAFRERDRDTYRATVAADLSMHHQVIGQLVQQVTGLLQRVKVLEDAAPKIEVVQSIPPGATLVMN